MDDYLRRLTCIEYAISKCRAFFKSSDIAVVAVIAVRRWIEVCNSCDSVGSGDSKDSSNKEIRLHIQYTANVDYDFILYSCWIGILLNMGDPLMHADPKATP